jgi:hypothetical protein
MSEATPGVGHNNPPPEFDLEKRIGQYVKLRDKIKEIKDRHKEELKPFNEGLDMLGAMLLNHLNATKQDSANARAAGTAYRTKRAAATIADAEAFRRHVIGTEDWGLLDWKANATAVAAFLEEHETLPPGVNYSVRDEIGVRRA